MAEISETPPNDVASQFDPKTMRKSKPGLKRLLLTLTVLFSFLLGLPFLLKSIEIYRSPLPFQDIDVLSNEIESTALLFPCNFHAVFVNFDHSTSTKSNADKLGLAIDNHMKKFGASDSVCGSCMNNYSVSVTLDSTADCVDNRIGEVTRSWQCGAIREYKFGEDLDDDIDFDEYLGSVFRRDGKVYTVVVVNTGEGVKVRAVVGKHRHAWIVGGVLEMNMVVERVGEIFVKVFVNGGREEGSIHGEYMPVGADGKIVLSFNLLNADPSDWIYDWYETSSSLSHAVRRKISVPK